MLLGPLDENEAITGAGFLPNNVLAGVILMVVTDFIVSLKKLHACMYKKWSNCFVARR